MADKMTKREMFTILDTFVPDDAEHAEVLHAFIAKQIEMIDAKAEKARERAAERKMEGDELRAMVAAAVTDEFQTADQIMEAMGLDDPDLTKAKIVARLSQLVTAEEVVKQAFTVDKKRKMHYKLAE